MTFYLCSFVFLKEEEQELEKQGGKKEQVASQWGCYQKQRGAFEIFEFSRARGIILDKLQDIFNS